MMCYTAVETVADPGDPGNVDFQRKGWMAVNGKEFDVELSMMRQIRFMVSSRQFGATENFPIEYTVEYGEDEELPEELPPLFYVCNAWVRRARGDNLYFLISSNMPAHPILQVVEDRMIQHLATDRECLDKIHALIPKLQEPEPALLSQVLPLSPPPQCDPDVPITEAPLIPMENYGWILPCRAVGVPGNFDIQFKVEYTRDEANGNWYYECWVRKMMHPQRYRAMTFTLPLSTPDPVEDSFKRIRDDPDFQPRVRSLFAVHVSRGDLDPFEETPGGKGSSGGFPRHGKGNVKKRKKAKRKKKR